MPIARNRYPFLLAAGTGLAYSPFVRAAQAHAPVPDSALLSIPVILALFA